MKLVQDLKNFALRGNVIDLVVGFTVGAVFTSIAKSLVDDIIMPPVGALMGNIDFADMYVVLKGPADLAHGLSPAAAKAAGAVTLNLRHIHQQRDRLRAGHPRDVLPNQRHPAARPQETRHHIANNKTLPAVLHRHPARGQTLPKLHVAVGIACIEANTIGRKHTHAEEL